VLSIGFLAIIFGVPVSQVVVELRRGVPVRYTDIFRALPTRNHLRAFETSLENSWWGQTRLRPATERWLFSLLGRTNSKALPGTANWLFYRPGVDYLVARDRVDAEAARGRWMAPSAGHTCRENALRAIVRFRDQLKERRLQLLVVPIPGKACIYPDRLTRRAAPTWQTVRSPTEDLLAELDGRGVNTVSLFAAFRAARRRLEQEHDGRCLYLRCDTHWTPVDAAVAAAAVARAVRRLGPPVGTPYQYATRSVHVRRVGDVIAMLGLPDAAANWPNETVVCSQVIDPFLQQPLLPNPNQRAGIYMNQHLLDTPMEARFLLLGDSFSRIYQLREPASLGRIQTEGVGPRGTTAAASTKKQPIPGAAGFPSLLANALSAPVDFIVSDGGAATRVRQTLNVTPEILEHKEIVIWEFAERDLQLGRAGWQDVPLPDEP